MKTSSPKFSCLIQGLIPALAIVVMQPAWAALTLADAPLYTSLNAVAPNLVATIDESGSMAWAYVPDSLDSFTSTKRFRSSDFNALYYNPSIVYNPPPRYNGTTCSMFTGGTNCYPNVSFTAAPLNGFNTSLGSSVNLSSAYKAASEYPIESGGSFTWTGQTDAGSDPAAAGGAAYYYRFWNDGRSPSLAKPGTCTAATTTAQKASDNCYVLITIGSASDSTFYGTTSATVVNQRQNFANWYSYYRSRIMAATTGIMTGFGTASSKLRLAWQGLHDDAGYCGTLNNASSTFSCQGRAGTTYDNRMRPLGEVVSSGKTHKQEFYEWLVDIKLAGGTPTIAAMHRAGQYFQLSASTPPATHPLAESPPTTAGTLRTCRLNYSLLVTDGGWCDDDSSSTTVGDKTAGPVTLPVAAPVGAGGSTTTSWTPGAPYKDGQGYNLADIAFYFWVTPMKTGVTYNVPVRINDPTGSDQTQWLNPRNDPATWLHLNSYTVGLGMSNTLTGARVDGGATTGWASTNTTTTPFPLPIWQGSTFASNSAGDGYAKLALGTGCPSTTTVSGTAPSPYCWPATKKAESCAPADISQQYKVYDMWHSAVVSRGQFFSADNPKQITSALSSVLNQVSESHGAASALAANSTSLSITTMIFQAKMDTTGWNGKLLGTPISSSGVIGNPAWDAATKMPTATARKIYTWPGSGGTAAGQLFLDCTTNLSTTQKEYLDKDGSGTVDNLCTDRLNWLRGDHSKEAASGGNFRSRVTTKFKDESDIDGDGNRTEYVTPSFQWILGDIVNSDPVYVLNRDYGYALASGLSAAEKSSYTSFVTSNASRTPMVYVGANDGMLHAFNGSNSGTSAGVELFAYVPNGVYPTLSKLTDQTYQHTYYVDGSPAASDVYFTGGTGGWRTVLVGGLNAGGKSVYALNITSPSTFGTNNILWEYPAASATDNDLGYTYSQPQIGKLNNGSWVAVFGNGYNSANDRAYLYVVNVETGALIQKIAAGTSTSNGLSTPVLRDINGDGIYDYAYAGDLLGNLWKFDLSNPSSSSWTASVLFKTSANQPITAQPQLGSHSAGGTMVYFGTGQYLTTDDVTSTNKQAFYGIWDKPSASLPVPLTDLVQQSITAQSSFRTVSSAVVDYTAPANKRGWYLPLAFPSTATSSQERVVSAALLKTTRLIFTTIIPSASDPCTPGGESWLMEVDPLTGGQLSAAVLDLNGDGTISAGEAAAGMKLSIGATKTPVYMKGASTGADDFKFMSGTSGGVQGVRQTCDSGCSSSSSSSSTTSSSSSSATSSTMTKARENWQQIQ